GLLHLDMNTYFPIVEKRVSPESSGEAYGFSIDSIELVGDVTAIAIMRSSLFAKDYIDLLALINIDGNWQIISKVSGLDTTSKRIHRLPVRSSRKFSASYSPSASSAMSIQESPRFLTNPSPIAF
ncbi:MAG: nuclear transport factor 2 family protein, partial [Verrucomicrobiota bacterium]